MWKKGVVVTPDTFNIGFCLVKFDDKNTYKDFVETCEMTRNLPNVPEEQIPIKEHVSEEQIPIKEHVSEEQILIKEHVPEEQIQWRNRDTFFSKVFVNVPHERRRLEWRRGIVISRKCNNVYRVRFDDPSLNNETQRSACKMYRIIPDEKR